MVHAFRDHVLISEVDSRREWLANNNLCDGCEGKDLEVCPLQQIANELAHSAEKELA